MFSKTNIVSTIVTAIWSFAGGFLLWGIIGDPFMKEHLGSATGVMKEPVDFVMLAIGCIIQGLIFSSIYSKWARGHHSVSEGAKFGLSIGALAGFGNGVIDFATSNMLDLTGTFINGIIYVIFFTIMGVLASLIYNKLSSSQE